MLPKQAISDTRSPLLLAASTLAHGQGEHCLGSNIVVRQRIGILHGQQTPRKHSQQKCALGVSAAQHSQSLTALTNAMALDALMHHG